jgi:hypothetical protein
MSEVFDCAEISEVKSTDAPKLHIRAVSEIARFPTLTLQRFLGYSLTMRFGADQLGSTSTIGKPWGSFMMIASKCYWDWSARHCTIRAEGKPGCMSELLLAMAVR